MIRTCGECYALVAPQHTEDHLLWHANQFEGVERDDFLSACPDGESLMVPLERPREAPDRRLDYPNRMCAEGAHIIEPASTRCTECGEEVA